MLISPGDRAAVEPELLGRREASRSALCPDFHAPSAECAVGPRGTLRERGLTFATDCLEVI